MRYSMLLVSTLTLGAVAGAAGAGLCGPLAVAAAQDAKTYALDAEKKYEVGDVYAESETTDNKEKVVVTAGGQEVQRNEKSVKLVLATVTKVLSVDDQGAKTKSHIYFAKFSRSEEGFDDDTLTGKVIELVVAAGGKRSWRHHAGEGNIGSAAKSWLEKKYGDTVDKDAKDKGEKALRPTTPVAVGGSWTPDVSALTKDLGMPIDTDKVTAKCTLQKIESRDGVELAWVKFEAAFPVQGFPGMEGMQVTWTSGGTMNFNLTGTMPTSARIAPGEKSGGFSLKGEADMQGALISLDISEDSKETFTLGGTIPDLPLIPVTSTGGGGEGDGDGGK